jgi:23S rRNA (adenine2503-C2)-methyltransferase
MTAPDPSTPQTPTSEVFGRTGEDFAAAARAALGIRDVRRLLGAYRALFRQGDASLMEGLGVQARAAPVSRVLREESSEGEVVKFAQRVPGAVVAGRDSGWLETESVLIPMIASTGERTYTLCVSSQIGCAMGCTFCETGQMGLMRSLTAAEIVGQWWAAAHVVGIRPKNIVFMGMGEPMDNLDEVIAAIAVLKDHNGPHVPISQITVSTVGRVDGIQRLSQKVREPGWHRLGLALSLNAPNDADRSAIMPVNRKWNLGDLQRALVAWPVRSGNKVCVEYVLIPGVNDSEQHAAQIAEFMTPLGLLNGGRVAGQKIMGILNLIPYNPRRDSPWPAPDEAHVERFLGWLHQRGVFAKRRRTKGRGMMGACGQLGTEAIRQRRLVGVTVSA